MQKCPFPYIIIVETLLFLYMGKDCENKKWRNEHEESVIGNATTEICKPILMEIGRSITAKKLLRKTLQMDLKNTIML